jgi:kynurenine formamidase
MTALSALLLSCTGPRPSDDRSLAFAPSEVIDLGASVTEDLPQRVWGKALLKQLGYARPNSFEVIRWTFPMAGASVSGSNAYYTFFNHGGPHVDAPNHMGEGGGLDSYPLQAFSGPLKVFDASGYPPGRSVPAGVFRGHVQARDIVLIFTRYKAPETDETLPAVTTLTLEAAELLATLPVRAYGTDALSVENLEDRKMPSIHHTFLSRTIPVYEQLFNVDKLLGKDRMFFSGAPLNIKAGDGMIVRPVVFVY